jgi:two-component system, NarL family, sensor histidine kinase DevS
VASPTTHARARRRAQPTVERTVESLMLEERTKWALRIHDRLTQSVTGAVLELQTLRHRVETDPEAAVESLKQVEQEIRADLRDLRDLLFDLYEGGAPESEPTLAGFVDELVARWKIPARVSVSGDLEGVPEVVTETAHGIIAEAIANSAKHSGSPDVVVRVRAGDAELSVEVEDRGKGITPIVDEDPHFGLRQMRARAEKLGGTIEIDSTPGHGTRVVAVLPVGVRGDAR